MFDFNLDASPRWLPKILLPVWSCVWVVAFIGYLLLWLLYIVYRGIRWLITPKQNKVDAKTSLADRKAGKEAKTRK